MMAMRSTRSVPGRLSEAVAFAFAGSATTPCPERRRSCQVLFGDVSWLCSVLLLPRSYRHAAIFATGCRLGLSKLGVLGVGWGSDGTMRPCKMVRRGNSATQWPKCGTIL